MDPILFFFFENASIVIAVMYLSSKIRERFNHQISNIGTVLPYAVFFTVLTLIVMLNPYDFEGMRLDLREAPLFLAGFLGGWKVGVLSALIPGSYRLIIGGPTVIQGLLQAVVLPIFLGSLFHKKNNNNHPYTLVNIRRILFYFSLYELIKSIWMLMTTPATLEIIIQMFIFALLALLGISAILNDFHRATRSTMDLEFFSNHDPMTGLPNMRFFTKKVNQLISDRVPIMIAMFDVDYFKQYNDMNGHQAGDDVLKHIGEILQENVRASDVIGRYGGEEFIICYSNISDKKEVATMSNKLRKDIEEYRFDNETSQPTGNITISIGVSSLAHYKSLDQLIGEADNALYEAKQKGRNQICYS
ncbi:diguanylate cyclase [Bacillaceae bacterium S4-13-56]